MISDKLVVACSHVNKKALDQYTNFTEQREELSRRQTENGRGEDKIKQLIQTLDMRKDEAIERTFKASPFAVITANVNSLESSTRDIYIASQNIIWLSL